MLDYENEHADRVRVVQIMQHRLDSLESGDSEPSGGDPAASAPEVGGGAVHTAQASSQTQGPRVNSTSHGDPTNPAQPRT